MAKNYISMWVNNKIIYVCYKISQDYQTNSDNELASAVCMSEGIGGELVVTDDFGCILYEEDI
jgi:hypothetical protein